MSAAPSSDNVAGMTTPTYLSLREIAELVGVEYRTIRNYHQMAERRRRESASSGADVTRPGDFPKPDDTFSRTPVWKVSTIRAWEKRRPGRGVGGGRPSKTPTGAA